MILSSGVGRNATVVVAVIVTGAALLWAGPILTPLVLALFLLVLVDGFARFIARHVPFLPEWSALPVALILSTLIFGLCVYTVVDNAAAFGAELIGDAPKLQGVIAGIAGLFGVKVPPTVAEMINQLNPTRYLGDVARYLQTFGMGAFGVLIYLGFMIASRQGFQKKVNSLFPDHHDRDHATAVFVRIRDGVQRYLWIQTITGLMIAVPSWGLMAAIGLSNSVFWAFFIFIASYIPVIGGAIGTVLPPLFALVQFPQYGQALAILVGLEVVMFVIGNVLQPRMQRDSLNIDPVVVLLSLAFWGAIWGLPGMFLSTPLTVTAIIVLAQFEGSRWIAVLLSGDGEPESDPVLPPRRPTSAGALPPPIATSPPSPAEGVT
jgi:predicted PurR-regulated permease PerM